MIGGSHPEYEQLRQRIGQLEAQLGQRDRMLAERDRMLAERDHQIVVLEARISELTASVASLKETMGRNSTNSGQPPSCDPPQVREARPKKQRGLRKRGGQKGHPGHHRAVVPPEQVTHTQECYPDRCYQCGRSLDQKADPSPVRHQVIDLPAIRPEVTEYRLHEVTCPACQTPNRGVLPEGVSDSAFGSRLVAFIGLLTGGYRLSKDRAAELLRDGFGVEMSVGSISQCEQRLSRCLAEPVDEAKDWVTQQRVKYCDATGWRQSGSRRQLWTIATSLVTVFLITLDGTRETVKRILGEAVGYLVSDRAKVFEFWSKKYRQVCWAHLIRTFTAIFERTGESRSIGEGLLYQAHRLFTLWHRVRDRTLKRSSFQVYAVSVRQEVKRLLEQGVHCDHAKTRRTCLNILAHFEALWTFVRVEGVEPTNNEGERSVRHSVIWRKLCFGTQSERGNRYVERIMTAVATLRKQSRNILEYLTACYQAALSHKVSPSLVPLSLDAT